jgi:uncharacterized caspase-like protein
VRDAWPSSFRAAGILRKALACLLFAGLPAIAQAPLDLRVALVIGNSAYGGAAALLNPSNDAAAMAFALRTLGFSVVELRDASRAQMIDALARVRGTLKGQQGIGMLYFAGHGLQIDFHNYMVPVDAKLTSRGDVPGQAIDVAEVVNAFRAAGNRMNIVVLDACRDNPFGGTGSAKGLAPMDAPTGTFLAYATAPGNVAADGDAASGNGLYTGFLVRELQKPATRIEDIFKRVRLQVRQRSGGRQIPWESTSLEDDFFFNDGSRHTFQPEDLARVADAARARQEKIKRDAEQSEDQERKNAALQALEQLRVAEAERIKELEAAALLLRESERINRLSKEAAREQAFALEKADWERVKASGSADDLYAFLKKHPSGYVSELAQFTLDSLQKPRVEGQIGENGVSVLASGFRRYYVGDKLVYDRTEAATGVVTRQTRRVTAATEDRVEFDGGAWIEDQMGSVQKNGLGTFQPGLMTSPSDLALGKHWKTAYEHTRRSGMKSTSFWDFKVIALEDIAVPAGTFKAYKIEGSGEQRWANGNFLLGSDVHWIDPATMVTLRTDRIYRNAGKIAEQYSVVLVNKELASRPVSMGPGVLTAPVGK